ncbi:MAG TPA: hypothetical protein VFU36_07870 [Jatrophihabitans sp.]|nr:hypothetical protein [Jatrophihabitans sp.]
MQPTEASETIRSAAASLAELPTIDRDSLARWATEHHRNADVLGLAVGVGIEKLKNALKSAFDTSGYSTLARTQATDLIAWLDDEYDLVRQLNAHLRGQFSFGDILVARAGSRVTAVRAGQAGRDLEDSIEAIAKGLGLSYELRTRFVGRNGQTGPCDLVMPSGQNADIAVAAKVFDSTGSKLTAAYDEIKAMADVRQPRQYIMAVVDGIGWKSRMADLTRIYELAETKQIDGMYTLATLDRFRADLEEAARLRGLLPTK